MKSLVAEKSIFSQYMETVRQKSRETSKKNLCLGVILGISQIGQFVVFGVIFYASGIWRVKYDLDMEKVFIAMFTLIFGVIGASSTGNMVGDLGAAKKAAKEYFNLLNIFLLSFDSINKIQIKSKIHLHVHFFIYIHFD